jgi:hypothetical protein
VHTDQTREHVDDAPRANGARHVDRQAQVREIVDDGQALDLLPIGAGIEDEMIRPDVIGGPRRQRSGSRSGNAPAWTSTRQLQPGLAPQPFGS